MNLTDEEFEVLYQRLAERFMKDLRETQQAMRLVSTLEPNAGAESCPGFPGKDAR